MSSALLPGNWKFVVVLQPPAPAPAVTNGTIDLYRTVSATFPGYTIIWNSSVSPYITVQTKNETTGAVVSTVTGGSQFDTSTMLGVDCCGNNLLFTNSFNVQLALFGIVGISQMAFVASNPFESHVGKSAQLPCLNSCNPCQPKCPTPCDDPCRPRCWDGCGSCPKCTWTRCGRVCGNNRCNSCG